MTKESLQSLKTISTWSGVFITLCGIALNLANGGSMVGGGISLLGVLITCCGHWAANALAACAKAEKAEDEKRIADLRKDVRQVAQGHQTLLNQIDKNASLT